MTHSQPQFVQSPTLELATQAIEELLARHEAEEAVEHYRRFLSLASHDLRTPLAVIKSSTQLIARQTPSDTKFTAASHRILRAVDRADGLIETLLDAHRLQAGLQLELSPAPCDLTVLIRETVEYLSHLHPGRLHFSGAASLEGSWDAMALRRAIENLVSNAIKYGAADGPVSISLTASTRIQIAVHNVGNPIPSEELAMLFRWHARARSAQTMPGWGLGLMLVKTVAEAHGGSVSVESSADSGTTFTIELPLAETVTG